MAKDFKLKYLGLPAQLTDKLAYNNIVTAQDFLDLAYVEWPRKTGLTSQKLENINEVVIKAVAPLPRKASSLTQPTHVKLNNELDFFLGGGIKCGEITEFSGPPGLGKTQICFQLALSAALQNEASNGVLYIDSEGAFSPKRIVEIALGKYGMDANQMQTSLSQIHVWRPESLKNIIDNMVSIRDLIIQKGIGLVILDSMGSIVRRQFGTEKIIERGAQMCSLSSSLKLLADELKVAVVVTNHVTHKINSEGNNQTSSNNMDDNESSIIPALGISWSHWINTRLYLSQHGTVRRIAVIKSPLLPEVFFDYRISEKGIEITEIGV